MENGRVHHEGLTLLIPELSSNLTVITSGWVDLDENIDIRILVNLSGLVPSRIDLPSSLTQAPLELHMTGTIKHPRIRLPAGRNVVDELAGRLDGLTGNLKLESGNERPNLSGAISDLVGGLVGDRSGKPDTRKTTRGIFDLIKSLQNDSEPTNEKATD